MLWLALDFPQLALDVLADGGDAAPFAVCAADGGLRRVVACNGAAAALGVRAGLPLASALALCAALRWVLRRPALEAAALRRRATWASRWSAQVALVDEDCLLFEVGASARLFGGLRSLLERLRAELREAGFTVRVAGAPFPAAALLLARAGVARVLRSPERLAAQIAPLPVTLLGLPESTRDALEAVGVRTLGALLALPRGELARRYGQDCVDYLDRLRGRLPEPLVPFRVPERFRVEVELPAPVQQAEALGFAARRLLRELVDWLEVRQLALRAAAFVLRHDDAPATTIPLGVARPTRDLGHLEALLRVRLEAARLAAPVESLALEAVDCAAAEARSEDLFRRPGADADAAARLFEQLRARLGEGALQQWQLRADHRPERAYTSAPEGASGEDGEGLPARPLFLLDPPRPLAEWDALTGSRVSLVGPERIESGWWDEGPVARDYYRAQDADGVTYWLFRERDAAGGWFVHGLFA